MQITPQQFLAITQEQLFFCLRNSPEDIEGSNRRKIRHMDFEMPARFDPFVNFQQALG